MARKHRKNYNWDVIRKEFQGSNLTYSAFSTQKGIPKSTAYAHLKGLIALKNSTSKESTAVNYRDESFDFVPIEVLEAEAAASAPEVTFIQSPEETSNTTKENPTPPIEVKIKGYSIVLNQGFDKSTLKAALEVLTDLC